MTNGENIQLALGDIMTSTSMGYDLHQLCDVIGPRPTGSVAEKKARDYLVSRFRHYGIKKVWVEQFVGPNWRRGTTTCRIVSPFQREITLLALPLNLTHKLTAPVVWAPFATYQQYENIAPLLKGKICINMAHSVAGTHLLHRGERIRLAHEAGAVGFLWASDRQGQILPTGSMDSNVALTMPAFGVSQEDALLIRRIAEHCGDVVLEVATENQICDVESWNIVAEIPGGSAEAPLVLLTAHYDSHDILDGAFDNAAGCSIVLEAARVLAKYYTNGRCRIRFILFSAEEVGLLGSTSYTRQHADELSKIRMMYNFDGLGAMPSSKYIHVPLRDDLVEFLQNVYHDYGYDVEVEKALHLNWDHAPFAVQGVPVASLTAKWPVGTLLHYGHTSADTLEKIDLQDMRYLACCATLMGYEVAVADSWEIKRGNPQTVIGEIRAMGKGDLLTRFI